MEEEMKLTLEELKDYLRKHPDSRVILELDGNTDERNKDKTDNAGTGI